MNNNSQGPSRSQIYQRLDSKRTDELLELWRTGNRQGWTGSAFDVIGEILRKRLGRIPLQAPSSMPVTRSPRIPWLLIILVIGVVLILAAVVFSNSSTARTAFALTLTRAATPAPTVNPTETPEATHVAMPSTTPVATPAATSAITTATDLPFGTSRPSTGVILPNQGSSGYGELSIENGTTRDGVVILTLGNDLIMAVYIRSGDSFTMTGIHDGIYYLYFSTGDGWNGKEFTITPSYEKFEDTLDFTTDATTYTTWNVTLQGVVGGNASIEDVDESEFPDIGG